MPLNGLRLSGEAGTAAGLTDWFIPNLTLSAGINTITVAAVDFVGNRSHQSIEVTYNAPDSQEPALSISGSSVRDVSTPTIMIEGTSSDNGRGSSGIASVLVGNEQADNDATEGAGTSSWSAEVALRPGANIIAIVATDGSAAENEAVSSITVNYTPDPRTFEGWAFENGLFGDDAAPDVTLPGASYSNLIAFAFGADPLEAGAELNPRYELISYQGELRHALCFERLKGAQGIDLIMQRGLTLDDFIDEALTELVVVRDLSTSHEEVVLIYTPDSNEETPELKTQFFRLKVTKNE